MVHSLLRLGPHDHDLNVSTFRKTAFGVTAAMAIAGASVLASFPANAQQAVRYTGTPICAPFAGSDRAIKCEIEQSQLRTKAANARGEAANARGAAADELKACLLELQGFKAKSPDRFDALGPITRENACTLAARLKPAAGQARPSG